MTWNLILFRTHACVLLLLLILMNMMQNLNLLPEFMGVSKFSPLIACMLFSLN